LNEQFKHKKPLKLNISSINKTLYYNIERNVIVIDEAILKNKLYAFEKAAKYEGQLISLLGIFITCVASTVTASNSLFFNIWLCASGASASWLWIAFRESRQLRRLGIQDLIDDLKRRYPEVSESSAVPKDIP